MNVSPSEARAIKKMFPDINKVMERDEKLGYKQFSISIFSHYLTKKECNVLLDNISNNIERIRTKRLENFVTSLCREFNCYLIVYNKNIQMFACSTAPAVELLSD